MPFRRSCKYFSNDAAGADVAWWVELLPMKLKVSSSNLTPTQTACKPAIQLRTRIIKTKKTITMTRAFPWMLPPPFDLSCRFTNDKLRFQLQIAVSGVILIKKIDFYNTTGWYGLLPSVPVKDTPPFDSSNGWHKISNVELAANRHKLSSVGKNRCFHHKFLGLF